MKSRTNTPGAAVHNLGPAVQRASGRRVRIGAFTVLLAILSGLATFLVLTGLTPISPTHNVVVTALLTNGLLLLCLTALILIEIVRLVQAHRKALPAPGCIRALSDCSRWWRPCRPSSSPLSPA